MCPIPLYDMIRNSKDPRWIRFKMVNYAKKYGVKPAARVFATTPKTVRKWLSRWVPGTLQGLSDQSRAPKNHPHQIPKGLEKQIIALKRRLPTWGAKRLKRDFELPCSEKAIQRVYRQNGLTKKRRRKHKTKNDLRAIKAAWPLFSQVDADTKDLFDIPEYWIQMRRYNLPRVQYTAREVVSGLQFIAYAQERSLSFANLFAQRIIGCLQQNGVDLSQTIWQTDNGSEFIGSWQARDKSAFTKTIESIPGQRHKQIPPGAHTYQSDLETVHSLIESEFYEIESFSSREDFLNKAASYQLFFNIVRKNSSKGDRTPLEIIKEREPTIDPRVGLLPPVFLDELLIYQLDNKSQGGYHVPSYPSTIFWTSPKILRGEKVSY